MERFVILCGGGFCNRLNSLIVGLILAEKLRINPTVIWPKNDMCGLALDLIFDELWFDVLDSHALISAGEWDVSKAIIHVPSIPYLPYTVDYRYFDSLDEAVNFYNTGGFYMGAYANNMIPAYVPQNLTLEMLARLRFKKNILDRVDDVMASWHVNTIYGIHMRATDHPSALRSEPIFNFVRDMYESTFFVCSDDIQIEQMFSQLSNVRLNNKDSRPHKQDVNREWFYKKSDGTYDFNIVRNADVVMDGLVDLLLLSRTRLLCQPDIGSSYWSCARLLNQLWRHSTYIGTASERIPVYAYAAGSLLTRVITEVDSHYQVVGVVDSDASRWGQNVHGLTIESPQALLSHDYPVLICTYQVYAAYEYLKSTLGITNRILFQTH